MGHISKRCFLSLPRGFSCVVHIFVGRKSRSDKQSGAAWNAITQRTLRTSKQGQDTLQANRAKIHHIQCHTKNLYFTTVYQVNVCN